jgi:8-oxo-dGTP pyrophosphatase MutT (NUDIX family)
MNELKNKQVLIAPKNGRQFSCFPAAVVVFVVNEKEEFLMLSHPDNANQWEPVNGGVESYGSILDNALRELKEEIGSEVKVKPLGTVHTMSFNYDSNCPNMISICYLMKYISGDILPGDDMEGSDFKWFTLKEINYSSTNVIVPKDGKWIFERAIELFRLWKDREQKLEND